MSFDRAAAVRAIEDRLWMEAPADRAKALRKRWPDVTDQQVAELDQVAELIVAAELDLVAGDEGVSRVVEHLTPAEAATVGRARELLEFLEGFADAGGNPELLRRARLLAGDTIDLANALEAERSGSKANQEARDRCFAVLARQAGDATIPKLFRDRARAAIDAEAESATR